MECRASIDTLEEAATDTSEVQVILEDAADPGAVWQYAERYLGVGTRSYSDFSADLDISQACHPQLGRPSFELPTFVVPFDKGEYLCGSIRSKLHPLYCRSDAFLLPVHPDTLTVSDLPVRAELLRCEPGPPIEVVPSGNARTVFAERIGGLPVEPHFLKLHYPRRLSRFPRHLHRPFINLQLWVADELYRIGAPFLPEVGGAWFGHNLHEAWGFVLREFTVRDDLLPRFTVPLFALYGSDFHSPGDPTLLEQLIVRSGEQPEIFICERIIKPIVRARR
ncbi:MAG: hypothetical protein H0T78_11255 [Longispora sp.]|nr:hypothetical protein [Longispora sp. (in: high G+C Gram-positive bacteria)]